ncbi:MAG: hypothetical protein ABSG99_04430 [Sedimentisphaerales bacterium]
MSKNRTYEQKHLAGQWSGAKCVRPVRPFAETGMMCIDLNVTTRIKEDSP